jgi:hypothetical protein
MGDYHIAAAPHFDVIPERIYRIHPPVPEVDIAEL